MRVFAGLTFLTLTLAACSPADDTQSAKLRILSTTDLHMYMNDYDYYQDREDPSHGLVRTATLIENARGEVANSILVDAGDLIQGSPMGDEAVYGAQGEDVPHAAFAMMNALGYDAAAAGNHEFNYGLDFFKSAVADAGFPYLSANVYVEDGDDNPANDETLLPPYAILERMITTDTGAKASLKIGVIGFLPPQIMIWDGDKLRGKVRTQDIVKSAEHWLPKMRAEGADIILAVAHTGLSAQPYNMGAEQSGAYLAAIEGIDAVITGHSHSVFPGPAYQNFPGADVEKGTVHGKPVVMAGYFGSHLGVIDLDLERGGQGWHVVSGKADVRPLNETPALAALDTLIAPYHERTRDYMAQPVGELSADLTSYLAHLRDIPALDLVAQAQRSYVLRAVKDTEYQGLPVLSAVAPFKAGGRPGPDYYTDIPAGPITLRHVADLYVYPNVISAVVMTGAQVREWLEMSVRIFNTIDPRAKSIQPLVNDRLPSYNFDILDGVSFEIDLTKPPRYGRGGVLENPDTHRIVNMRYKGEVVANDQRFIVATNNYRANGGGDFPGLDGSNVILNSTETVRDILAQYIRDQGTLMPATDDSWRFAEIAGSPLVSYQVGPKGADAVDALPGTERMGESDEGFVTFAIDLNALSGY